MLTGYSNFFYISCILYILINILVVKPKLRKIERKFVPVIQKLSQEDLIRSNTYVQFIKEINKVLENVEDYNTEYGKCSC